MQKLPEYVEVVNPNEFYNAVKEKYDYGVYCAAVDEPMFDLINEKYGIDLNGVGGQ